MKENERRQCFIVECQALGQICFHLDGEAIWCCVDHAKTYVEYKKRRHQAN